MDFIIFGDDWGKHISTAQHLVRNFPGKDRVIWVDSIGMRSPGMNRKDLGRICCKALLFLAKRTGSNLQEINTKSKYERIACQFFHVSPVVLPFHRNRFCRILNCWLLKNQILRAIEQMGMISPNILSANPVVVRYTEKIPCKRLMYLRLDEYAELPGVDRELILEVEPLMFRQASLIFSTAKKLIPQQKDWEKKSHYLPQGVDTLHFGQTSCEPSAKRILGFFGLVAEWLDFKLIEKIAKKMPSWVLEFRGPVRYLPEQYKELENVKWLPAVEYSELPSSIKEWTCAWIPFQISNLTESVNPLKIREYLASGLPSHSTTLPEVQLLKSCEGVFISERPEEIANWMEACFESDSREKRIKIRASVSRESWINRVEELQNTINSTTEKS